MGLKKTAARLVDRLTPGDDTLQVRLIRKDGTPHSGLYKDGDQEISSRNFPRKKR